MWPFWNQAAILGELACMALFLLVFVVIKDCLGKFLCWNC